MAAPASSRSTGERPSARQPSRSGVHCCGHIPWAASRSTCSSACHGSSRCHVRTAACNSRRFPSPFLKTAPQRAATPARLDDSGKLHRDVQFDSRSCRRRRQTADGSPPMLPFQTLSTKPVGGALTPSFLMCSAASEAEEAQQQVTLRGRQELSRSASDERDRR